MATPDPGAKSILTNFLKTFGLESLANWAWSTYTHAGGGDLGMQTVQADMYNRPEFKARFPAYDELAKQGRALNPAQMLQYEETARQIFRTAGLPAGFYDQPQDFAKLMIADVSAGELQNRVQIAQQATITAPPELRNQLQSMYGLDLGHLTSYFLDPDKALPILQQQFTAAQIGAAAQRTGFGNVSRDQAELLAQQGVTNEQAQSGFADLGAQRGLFNQQVEGEQAIDTQTQLGAEFGGNAAAAERVKRRKEERVADFAGSSGFNVGQKGVSGLGTSDLSRT